MPKNITLFLKPSYMGYPQNVEKPADTVEKPIRSPTKDEGSAVGLEQCVFINKRKRKV